MKNFKPFYADIFTPTQNENIEGYSEIVGKKEQIAQFPLFSLRFHNKF